MSDRAGALIVLLFVLCLRLPFLNQAIQGDDAYYLAAAEHALIDPLHPNHVLYVSLGKQIDMRGYPHPPLNAWTLALLIAAFGDVHEIPFHLAYIVFSLIAAFSVWSLARRFTEHSLLATLLCLATPAFIVNGNSLESDLPFLAFWLAAIALFVAAVESNSSRRLAVSAAAAVLAALAAYQAIILAPILTLYLWRNRQRAGRSAWLTTLAAPVTILFWQLFERASTGALPAAVLTGYMQTYGLETLTKKLENLVALTGHMAWIVGPLIAASAFFRIPRWGWGLTLICAAFAAFYDLNPLFWVSIGIGVIVLTWCGLRAREDFLAAWVMIFFAAALVVFFAGSQRYLLPIAAPVAILAARQLSPRWLLAGIALQLPLSLALAVVNFQHWDGYRQVAKSLEKECAQKRVWVNGEWGLRYYLGAEGALPMERSRAPRAGDLVVTSALSHVPVSGNVPLVPVADHPITATLPIRLIAMNSRSAYSAAMFGLRPFDASTGPIDRVRVDLVAERKPTLEYLDVRSPNGREQILSGIFPDGWTEKTAEVLLRKPKTPMSLRAVFYIPPQAAARKLVLDLNGAMVAKGAYPGPGVYTLTSPPLAVTMPQATVTLTVDKTFTVPQDQRTLGVLLTGIGFHP